MKPKETKQRRKERVKREMEVKPRSKTWDGKPTPKQDRKQKKNDLNKMKGIKK